MAAYLPPAGYGIEPLSVRHNRAAFACGVAPLNHYLKQRASQDADRDVARTYVLAAPDGTTIAGYYALSATGIRLDDLPEEIARKLPRYPLLPATLLGRLAVNLAHRGMGCGEVLLLSALGKSWDLSQQGASSAVVVDAKDDRARSFYERYGFRAFRDHPRRLFLPMKTIRRLFA